MAILSTAHRLLAALQLLSLGVATVAAVSIAPRDIVADLQGLVRKSPVAIETRLRWSDFEAPQPIVVVNATCERDIKAVVKYCNQNNLAVLPQNGGNGWRSFNNADGKQSVVLNMAGLNQVRVAADKQSAIIGGGAIISEVIAAADSAGVLVQTGNCNCVGALGAGLGGGFGNLVGELGMAVDNLLSLRVVTAQGEAITVDPKSNPDLWWAMRGAGPNFGVVTYATYKTLPTEDRTAWLMTLTFPGSRVSEVAQVIEDLPLKPNQVVFLILSQGGVMVTGFLRGGNDESGREAFASLYALGPATQSSSVNPYTSWNVPNDFFCQRGDRKPAFNTALATMNPPAWTDVFKLYDDFQKLPGAQNTAVVIERYQLAKARELGPGSSSSVQDALRGVGTFGQAIVIPWYKDSALDAQALEFASKVRDIWAGPAGGKKNPSYINFAHGDEDLEAIYGASLPRLQELKKKYDPKNVFSQWFSLAQ